MSIHLIQLACIALILQLVEFCVALLISVVVVLPYLIAVVVVLPFFIAIVEFIVFFSIFSAFWRTKNVVFIGW